MSKLRRYYSPGQIYFVTVVTNEREPYLVEHHRYLTQAFKKHIMGTVGRLYAHVILPDHFHAIVVPREGNLSKLLQKTKLSFSKLLRNRLGRMDGRVWQRRFWDHVIRDRNDLNHYLDYIHYNPVRHGFTSSPFDWQLSSIQQFAEAGRYDDSWNPEISLLDEGYGE